MAADFIRPGFDTHSILKPGAARGEIPEQSPKVPYASTGSKIRPCWEGGGSFWTVRYGVRYCLAEDSFGGFAILGGTPLARPCWGRHGEAVPQNPLFRTKAVESPPVSPPEPDFLALGTAVEKSTFAQSGVNGEPSQRMEPAASDGSDEYKERMVYSPEPPPKSTFWGTRRTKLQKLGVATPQVCLAKNLEGGSWGKN